MNKLTVKDIIALGFMTFALFVGAGNIIFPPMIGLQAGPQVTLAAFGFLVTAVGLPVLTIIAIARAGGAMTTLSQPIGKVAGLLLTMTCYLVVGPFFASPRTATVSYEIGLATLFGENETALRIYSSAYFLLVIAFSMYPDRLLDSIGRFLAPIKIVALTILGVAAFLYPVGPIGHANGKYIATPVSEGIVTGYLTMDTLAALVFGIVIINAMRSRGIAAATQLSRYAIIAGLIAGIGLILVYVSLFHLGAVSFSIAAHATNGAEILHAYVQYTFGAPGSIFLGILILVACFVTAIGLTIACAEFFAGITPLSYRTLVILFAVLSCVFANLGLTKLTMISEPILTAIYPPCIVLVLLSFIARLWPGRNIVTPTVMAVALFFGVFDAFKAAGFDQWLPAFLVHIPFNEQKLGWVTPALITLVIMSVIDVVHRRLR
jgi:LIVCS family branched-chain amino acid:cation transporter